MNPYLLIDLKQKIYWPMPNDQHPIYSLMEKLPSRFRVICALEAAKMVMCLWETYTSKFDHLSNEQKKSPLEIVEKWLVGKATKEEARRILGALTSIPRTAVFYAIAFAIYTVVDNTPIKAVEAITNAANAVADPANSTLIARANKKQFYNEWWRRCTALIQKEYNRLCKEISGNL